MSGKVGLVCSILLTSIFLIGSLGLIIFWVVMYAGSYVWDDFKRHPKLQYLPIKFNFHPTLMVGGFIFFSGFSMIFYKMITCCRKLFIKLLHTIFHAMGIACVAFGFLTIWEAKENGFPIKIPHFYSLHSWLGLATIGLYAIQFIVGFFSFLILLCCEKGTASCRASLVPTHSTFGLITFIMACATILVGLTETAFTSLKEADGIETKYRLNEPEAIVINALGVVIVASIIMMVWLLRSNISKRGSSAVSERL